MKKFSIYVFFALDILVFLYSLTRILLSVGQEEDYLYIIGAIIVGLLALILRRKKSAAED